MHILKHEGKEKQYDRHKIEIRRNQRIKGNGNKRVVTKRCHFVGEITIGYLIELR